MNIKKILTAIALIVLMAVPVGAFDAERGALKEFFQKGPDDYVNLECSIFDITVIGTAEGFYPMWDNHANTVISKRAVGVFGQQGSGMYIGKGYVATAAHVITPESVKIQLSENVFYVVPVAKVLNVTIFLGNGGLGNAVAEVVFIDIEHDIALLKVIGTWPALKDLGYRPSYTWRSDTGDLIHNGDAVAVIVQIRDAAGEKTGQYEVRYGKVLAPKPIPPPGMPNDVLPWFNPLDVTMDTVIYPGDSGSPVFAWVGGQPVLIGIARAAAFIQDESGNVVMYSYFSRIDPLYPFSIEK
jgi:hypothetical protein